MSKEVTKMLVPKLRFPEFWDVGGWETKPFDKAFSRITTKNFENNNNVLTISAQKGLVSQLDYFNKKVAAKDVSGYYLLHKGDFAYNKSYSKGYPMGAIKQLKAYEKGVVSTLYICFKANSGYIGSFFEQYFDAGVLNTEINKIAQEGGRAHGLLNVSVKEFFKNISLFIPQPDEQQKIADCLSSIDELITAHSQKYQALKAHKKGLMQQLFPAIGETVPKLRFPEFRDAGDWDEKLFGNIIKINSGKGFKASEYSNSGIRLLQIENVGYGVTKWNENTIFLPNSYVDEYPELVLRKGDIVLALNRPVTNNELKIARIQKNEPSILYQRVGKISLIDNFLSIDFVYQFCKKFIKDFVIKNSIGSDQPFISLRDLYAQNILIPKPREQQKIANCLSSLDDLITIHAQKIEALKAHKKGLMQQLFPAADKVNG
jgi:type I restriction enzyme S subunit